MSEMLNSMNNKIPEVSFYNFVYYFSLAGTRFEASFKLPTAAGYKEIQL